MQSCLSTARFPHDTSLINFIPLSILLYTIIPANILQYEYRVTAQYNVCRLSIMLVNMTECEESARTEELYTITPSSGQSLAPVGGGAAETQCVSQTDDNQDRDVEVRIMHEKGCKKDGAEQRVTVITESEDKGEFCFISLSLNSPTL